MKLNKFMSKCSQAGLKLAKKMTIDGIYVIIADGYSNGSAEMRNPHYRTVYALGNDENDLRLMQSVYHEFGKDLGVNNAKKQRIEDAASQAKRTVESLKHGGIFKSH